MYRKQNLILIDIYVLIFIIGYFKGFSCLNSIIVEWLIKNKALKWINSSVLIYILIALISIVVFFPFLKQGIIEYKSIDINDILSVFLIIAVFGNIIMFLLGRVNYSEEAIGENLHGFAIINALIFSPFIEELFCKCGFVTILEKQLRIIGIKTAFISAFLFSLFHLIKMRNLDISILIVYFLIYFTLGLGGEYVYRKSVNIWSSIILHILWNFSGIVGILIQKFF